MKYLFIVLFMFSSGLLYAQVDTLLSALSKWQDSQGVVAGNTIKMEILAGKALDLQELTVHTETIAPEVSGHKAKHSKYEELIIVKEGNLKITINEQTKLLGPASVALIFPKDSHFLLNESKEPVTYYVFHYIARVEPDFKRGEEAGGSFMIDWNDLEYKESEIGGRRDYFRRPTAMLNNFEMHVSTLNEGLTNHQAHTHKAEEFVLMIKGDVVMLVGEENFACSAGDVVFVSSMVPHALNNTGQGETMYFAFQFWQ